MAWLIWPWPRPTAGNRVRGSSGTEFYSRTLHPSETCGHFQKCSSPPAASTQSSSPSSSTSILAIGHSLHYSALGPLDGSEESQHLGKFLGLLGFGYNNHLLHHATQQEHVRVETAPSAGRPSRITETKLAYHEHTLTGVKGVVERGIVRPRVDRTFGCVIFKFFVVLAY